MRIKPALRLLPAALCLSLFGLAGSLPVAPIGERAVAVNLQQRRTTRIQFAPGRDSAVVQDSVVRGTRDVYVLKASKGQRMSVSITSIEDNAVFSVIAPPGGGRTRILDSMGTSWTGILPIDGDYQIAVGSTRGNASYKLSVQIR